jgi:hypothetical protein
MEEGGKTVSARALLVRMLQLTGSRLSWRLLYSSDHPRGYVLNLRIVKEDGL